jgi:pyrimidine-nucleoside phosphorylase/thymidine phosphorylase
MEREDDSRALATAMCSIGAGLGKDMVALITRMDEPLGSAVGNAVEVAECIECLNGAGPADLVSLSIELAAEMVLLAGRSTSIEGARSLCKKMIADGSALERFRKLVQAQGGDSRAIDDPKRLPAARRKIELKSTAAGIVRALEARPVGHATMLLGAGRARMDSRIDPAVGVILHKKVGAAVELEEPLCTLLVNDESRLDEAVALFRGAFRIGGEPVVAPSLFVDRIASAPARSGPGLARATEP